MDIELTKAEICAIEAHKYFMSQRYGHDVGADAARKDWLENCAAAWREERQRQMLDLERDEIRRQLAQGQQGSLGNLNQKLGTQLYDPDAENFYPLFGHFFAGLFCIA